jgi:hypothetical protein
MLAFAIQNPKWDYIHPALRTDGAQNGATGLIPAGMIFKLPTDTIIPQNFCPFARMVSEALIGYGMILADRSGCFTLYGQDMKDANPYVSYYGGLKLWDVMKQITSLFPQLKAFALD